MRIKIEVVKNGKVKTRKKMLNKSNQRFHCSRCKYAEACNDLAGPIYASLRPGNTAPSEEMSLRWQVVGNAVSNFTGLRFEPLTPCSRDKCITVRPTYKAITCLKFVPNMQHRRLAFPRSHFKITVNSNSTG